MIETNIVFEPGDSAFADIFAVAVKTGNLDANKAKALIRRAQNSAVSSAAWTYQKALKSTIATNALGWERPETYSPTGEFVLSVVKKYRSRNAKRPRQPITGNPPKFLGKLANALSYKVDKEDSSAQIGIIPGWRKATGRTETVFSLFQVGRERPVDTKMRKFFGALDIPLKATTSALKTPPRNLVGPVLQKEGPAINAGMEDKFLARLTSYKGVV